MAQLIDLKSIYQKNTLRDLLNLVTTTRTQIQLCHKLTEIITFLTTNINNKKAIITTQIIIISIMAHQKTKTKYL